MLYFLFPDDELQRLFDALGYDLRAGHGAQNDRVLRPADLARLDAEPDRPRGGPRRDRSRELVGAVPGRRWRATSATSRAARRPEGIHMGVMSGTLDVMQRIYLGTRDPRRRAALHPRLIDRLDGLSFPIKFRDTPMQGDDRGRRAHGGGPPEGAARPSGSASPGRVARARTGRPCHVHPHPATHVQEAPASCGDLRWPCAAGVCCRWFATDLGERSPS